LRTVTVAATQMACTPDPVRNLARAEELVREAAARGAGIVCVQELFETPYFCQDEIADFFALAKPLGENRAIARFSEVARELGIVVPVSVFERAGQSYFNTVAIVDADGSVLGAYRKSHIPDGPGYAEKYYFSPGDTGFMVWPTAYGRIGVGICWDQWFPEAARAMALLGAELLLYPTAIGSEPLSPDVDSRDHWQRAMQGHAAANVMPVVAADRVGSEAGRLGTSMTFYGSSFITDHTGAKLAEAGRSEETVLTATLDLDASTEYRRMWGIFRDRRPDLYGPLLTYDGVRRHVTERE
jgi:N-carbamoylputrescine amidase